MSNSNYPFGFRPVGHLFLDRIPAPRPYIMYTGDVIYLHDPVYVDATGTVKHGVAGQTTTHLGICAGYVPVGDSAAGKTVYVYDDPWTIFAVQNATTVVAATDVFGTADMITYAVGNTSAPYESIMALDTVGSTTTLPWKILSLYNYGNNAWGQYAIVNVIANQHFMFAGAGI